jgi:clan AA aspartic protease
LFSLRALENTINNIEGEKMGEVRADFILANYGDEVIVSRGLMPNKQIRKKTVNALVDTGTVELVIDEKTRKKLGLKIAHKEGVELADGSLYEADITEPVSIHWKDRWAACPAAVMPYATDILVGQVPLEVMNLIIKPAQQELVPSARHKRA